MIAVLVGGRLTDLFLHVMPVRLLEPPTTVPIDLHLAEAGLHHHSMKPTRHLKVGPWTVRPVALTNIVLEALPFGVEIRGQAIGAGKDHRYASTRLVERCMPGRLHLGHGGTPGLP